MSGLVLLQAYALSLVLLLLPMAACVLLARRFGITGPVLLVLSGMAGSGVLGFAAFWAYLISPAVGRPFAIVVDVGCALVLAEACRDRFARWRQLAVLAPITALYAAAGLFYLAMGYMYGGLHGTFEVAASRYVNGLPGDNDIPMLFAEQLESPHRPLPNFIMSDFQSSDRPPLQTDYQLLQDALLGHAQGQYLHPQVIGTLVQGLWIFGLWALLRAGRRPRWAVPLCLAAVLFSGFALLNSFYVWPKLVAAGGALAACAVLFPPEMRSVRASRMAGVLTGAALGCSLLAHPGTSFMIMGVLVVLAAVRRLPRLRFLLAGAGGLAVTYLPWMLYQRFYQPPANALVELQLANAPLPVRGKSTGHAIIDAYRRIGLDKTLSNKGSNFAAPFRHELDFLRNAADLVVHAFSPQSQALTDQARDEMGWQFFFIGTTLGLIGFGIVILAARGVRSLMAWIRAGRSRRASGEATPLVAAGLDVEQLLLLALAATYVVWCMLMFGPGSTVIHQGSHAFVVLAFALGVLGWWSLSPRLAAAVVGATTAFTLYLYLRFTPFVTGLGTPYKSRISTSIGALALFAVVACLACLWWIGKQPQAEPADDGAGAGAGGDPHATGADAPQVTIPTQVSNIQQGAPENSSTA